MTEDIEDIEDIEDMGFCQGCGMEDPCGIHYEDCTLQDDGCGPFLVERETVPWGDGFTEKDEE